MGLWTLTFTVPPTLQFLQLQQKNKIINITSNNSHTPLSDLSYRIGDWLAARDVAILESAHRKRRLLCNRNVEMWFKTSAKNIYSSRRWKYHYGHSRQKPSLPKRADTRTRSRHRKSYPASAISDLVALRIFPIFVSPVILIRWAYRFLIWRVVTGVIACSNLIKSPCYGSKFLVGEPFVFLVT